MKQPVLVTGFSGLVGSRVKELLNDKFDFVDLSLATGVDITKRDQVEDIIGKSPSRMVLHMAAKADVDGCEDDKILGEEGAAWMVNVQGTENVAESARKNNKRLLYISTDFVFDGTQEYYTESDRPNPVNWYGITKYKGEEIVLNKDSDSTIIRISYPYRAYYEQKPDFVRRVIEVMTKNGKIFALKDHIFTPTFIDDIACALEVFLKRELPGIYHVVGSESLPTGRAVKKIVETFKLKGDIIPIERREYFKNRAFRPFKLALKNDKILRLGIKMLGFDQGLKAIKNQLASQPS